MCQDRRQRLAKQERTEPLRGSGRVEGGMSPSPAVSNAWASISRRTAAAIEDCPRVSESERQAADKAAGPLLDSRANVVGSAQEVAQLAEEYHEIRKCRCRSKWCPHCKEIESFKLSRDVAKVVGTWRERIFLITLTVDGSAFPDRERVYRHLLSKRAPSEVMRALEHEGWIGRHRLVGMEFQGNGSVHFHCLVHAPLGSIPHHRIAHHWNRFRPGWAGPVGTFEEGERAGQPRPAVGFVQYERIRKREAAAIYVSKYVGKEGSELPAWFVALLDQGKRPKRFSTSRGFWAGVRPPRPRCEAPRVKGPSRPVRPFAERVRRCGSVCSVFKVSVVLRLGYTETRREYRGGVPRPLRDVANQLGFSLDAQATAGRLRPGEVGKVLAMGRDGPYATG